MDATIQESNEINELNSFDFNTLSLIITSSLLIISEILPFIKIIKANGILDFLKIIIIKLKKQNPQGQEQQELEKNDNSPNLGNTTNSIENGNNTTSDQNIPNFFNTIINKLDEISSRLNTRVASATIKLENDSSNKISIEFP